MSTVILSCVVESMLGEPVQPTHTYDAVVDGRGRVIFRHVDMLSIDLSRPDLLRRLIAPYMHSVLIFNGKMKVCL